MLTDVVIRPLYAKGTDCHARFMNRARNDVKILTKTYYFAFGYSLHRRR